MSVQMLSVLQNMALQDAEQVFVFGPMFQQRRGGEKIIFMQCHKIFSANQLFKNIGNS